MLTATHGTPHRNELTLLNRRLLEQLIPSLPKIAQTSKSLEIFPNNQVAVLVTTQAGYDDMFPFVHTEVRLPGRSRSILFVRDNSQFDDDTLRDVLRLNSDGVAAIMKAKEMSVPASLCRLFVPPPSDLLQSLLALSRAYLCATMSLNAPGPIDADALEAARRDIRLDGMPVPARRRVTELIFEGEPDVRNVEWWLRGLGLSTASDDSSMSAETLRLRFAQQWRAERFGPVPTVFTGLFYQLASDRRLNSPELIAQIYCDLVWRVLGRRCRRCA